MRIVNEVPDSAKGTSGKYPWEAISAAVSKGSVVELDPTDYNVTLAGLRSAASQAQSYADGRNWKVNQRNGKIYISPR